MLYKVHNFSCIPFYLKDSKDTKITIPAEGTCILYFNTEGKYEVNVTNLITGVGTSLEVTLIL